MQKWEYLQILLSYEKGIAYPYQINDIEQKNWNKGQTFHQYSNRLGDDGWELAGVGGYNGSIFVFKRPKP